jgi:hypothetical protein
MKHRETLDRMIERLNASIAEGGERHFEHEEVSCLVWARKMIFFNTKKSKKSLTEAQDKITQLTAHVLHLRECLESLVPWRCFDHGECKCRNCLARHALSVTSGVK